MNGCLPPLSCSLNTFGTGLRKEGDFLEKPQASLKPNRAMQPDLNLHIEELVVEGLPGMREADLGMAVRAELTRLLAAQGLPTAWSQGAEVGHLNAGSIRLAPNAGPEATGRQIAQSVYGGLKP